MKLRKRKVIWLVSIVLLVLISNDLWKINIENKTVGMDIGNRTIGINIENRTAEAGIEDRITGMNIENRIAGTDIKDRIAETGVEDRIVEMNINEEIKDDHSMELENKSDYKLVLSKNVTELKDDNNNLTGEYEVELKMNKIGDDIVFVIDNSYSLSRVDRWNNKVRPEFETLAENLFDTGKKYNRNIRIGIVIYSGKVKEVGSIDDANIIQGFTSDLNEIKNSLREVNTFGEGYDKNFKYVDPTNIEAGLLRAKEMFTNNNVSKHVILYCDGPPTTSIGQLFSVDVGKFNEVYKESVLNSRDILLQDNIEIIAAGEKVYESFFIYGKGNEGESGFESAMRNINYIVRNITTVNLSNEAYYDNLFTNLDTNEIKNILICAYGYTEDSILEKDKLEDISGVNIIDNISSDFTIVEDGYGPGETSLISFGNDENSNNKSNVNISEDKNSIYFNDLTVNYYGTTIKYKLKLKDDYLIKDDALGDGLTIATMDSNYIQSFNNPILNIKPIAKIRLANENDSRNGETDFEIADKNIKVIIENISNKEIVELNTVINNEENYSFVLRPEINDIENSLVIGEYKIKNVIISDNYQLVDVKINNKSFDENTFIINKKNSNVNIEVFTRKNIIPIKGKINIESITVDCNNIKENDNEILLKLISKDNNLYKFNLNLNDYLISNFYIVDNYDEIPYEIEKGFSVIKSGEYKLDNVIPMNLLIEDVEIKYNEDDLWQSISSKDYFNLSKENPNIFIRLKLKETNKKYWYKRA